MGPTDIAPDAPRSPERLASMFRPERVALVGASDKSFFSRNAHANACAFGFGDRVVLINGRGGTVHGTEALPSFADVDGTVDVALMMLPQARTNALLAEAAAAGVRNAVVLSSGYAETGEDGRRAQAELVACARELGMLLLGPNCLGFLNVVESAPVTTLPGLPHRPGSVGLVSQSGGSASAMLGFAAMSDIGFSHVITVGNEAMVSVADVLEFLVDDPATRAIALHTEHIVDPEGLRRGARRAASAGKPIFMLKAGRSELAARAIQAHTGNLLGDDRLVDAVLRDLAVIRVESIEDLILGAGLAAELGRLRVPGIGVASISGGACAVVADIAARIEAPLPELAPPARARLREALPAYGTPQNPLDVTGAAVIDGTVFTRCIAAIADDPAIGAVAAVQSLPWEPSDEPYTRQMLVDAIGAGAAQADVPVIAVNQTTQPVTARTREVLDSAGVAHVVNGLDYVLAALTNVGRWSERVDDAAEPAPAAPALALGPLAGGAWSEHDARELLSAAGVPIVPGRLVRDADEAAAAIDELGAASVALKVVSAQIVHKTEVGGVRLDVGAGDVRDAFEAVRAGGRSVEGAHVDGVLVTPMRSDGVELLVGVVRDALWGPVLAIAVGGIDVEARGDSVVAPLPARESRIQAMLGELRGHELLQGSRGRRPADQDRLAHVIARIGEVALALGERLESLEINPLRVDGPTVEALDAVVTWRADGVPR